MAVPIDNVNRIGCRTGRDRPQDLCPSRNLPAAIDHCNASSPTMNPTLGNRAVIPRVHERVWPCAETAVRRSRLRQLLLRVPAKSLSPRLVAPRMASPSYPLLSPSLPPPPQARNESIAIIIPVALSHGDIAFEAVRWLWELRFIWITDASCWQDGNSHATAS